MTTKKIHSSTLSGELDPIFGEKGLAFLHSPNPDFPNWSSRVVAVGPDDMIYIAGVLYDDFNGMLYALTRLNEAGSVDTSFGKQGFFYDFFYGSASSSFYAEQIAFVNGRVLLTGTLFYRVGGVDAREKAAVRFLPNGTIDEEFGEKGKIIIPVPKTTADLHAVSAYNEKCLEIEKARCVSSDSLNKLAPYAREASPITDDRIILLHYSGTFASIDAWIICLTSSGELDVSFNESGFVRVRHDMFNFLQLSSLIVDDAGNYISAGHVKTGYFNPPEAVVLVKHSKDGKLDKSFQRDGFLVMEDEDPLYYREVANIVKQPNNRILCTGSRHSRHDTAISGFLMSLEADGSNNIQFNGGKPVFMNINSSSTYLYTADFLPDGSFLTTGLLERYRKESHYSISRFFYNGVHDKDYNNGVGWLDYKEAVNIGLYSSAIKDNKAFFAVEFKEETVVIRAVAKGLMP
jgi:uncharacterized delta-60 repeat protein